LEGEIVSEHYRCGHVKDGNTYNGGCHACKKFRSREHARQTAKKSKAHTRIDWQGWSDQLSERERQWLDGADTLHPDPFGLFASP
jgi:hypothetical protein